MASNVIVQTLRLKDDASAALKKVSDSATRTRKVTKALKLGMAAAATAVTAMAAATAALAKSSISVGSQFEKAEVQLAKFTGSAAEGKARMDELFEIATTKPFELTDIIDAEVNLRALGVEAEKVLPMVLDFAGAMGTEVPQAAVELGRAMQFGAGAVETIAGRALRAQVELKTGTDALSMSTDEFAAALTDTLTDPDGIFAGGADELAKTFTGLTSMMTDQWTAFSKMISDAGFFQATKQFLLEILSLLNENSTGISDLASTIGTGLVAGLAGSIKLAGRLLQVFKALEILGKSILFAVLKLGEGIMFVVDLATTNIQSTLTAIGKVLGIEIPDVVGKARDSLSEMSKSVADDITLLNLEMNESIGVADAIAERVISAAGGTGGIIADLTKKKRQGPPQQQESTEIPKVTLDTDALQALGDKLKEAQAAAEARMQATFETIGNVMTGDLSAVISTFQAPIGSAIAGALPNVGAAAAGPIGMAVSQGVSLLVQLGQTGTDQIIANLKQFSDDLTAGIMELPDLMSRLVPEFVKEFIPAMIEALVRSAPELGWAMLKSPFELLATMMFDLPVLIAERLGEVFADLWDRVKEFFNNLLTLGIADGGLIDPDKTGGERAQTAGRIALGVGTAGMSELAIAMGRAFKEGAGMATGGFVDRTGIALVHQGERIVPASGASTQAARSMMGGGTPANVTINTNVVDPNSIPALVSEIERHFGNFGRGTSPLFQGA